MQGKSCFADRAAVESHKERAHPGHADGTSELGHVQERRQLSGSVSEEDGESRELRLRTVNFDKRNRRTISTVEHRTAGQFIFDDEEIVFVAFVADPVDVPRE